MAKVSLRAYNREIESLMDRGQLDEAIAHCHHILKTFPKHLETYRLLGKAYLEMKKRGDASDIFSRVLTCVPNDFVSHVGMSIIRDDENKLDDAIWHMERAFEAQPSNAAVQGELQRLYARRDGTAPPRIRMTRGALAQMYVQGELYPQAISEIKGVLTEDPGRSDMQSLLARAYYRSGQKNEAAEAASSLIRRYPYSFDANRVLVEILGGDRPESVQVYRQRVIELDPYAAHVSGSILQLNDAPDSAVALEHLDWNGQAVGSDWRSQQGISLESGARDEKPAWLTGGFEESKAPPLSAPTAGSVFDTSAAPQASSDDNIPDFLRAAGWGQSTGAFDESKSSFADDTTLPPTPAAPLAEGDMPDWVKAMAPPAETLKPAEEEDIPDWINKIGTGELKLDSTSADQPDWLKPATPAQPAAFPDLSNDEPDWMKGLGQPESSSQAATTPDWLSSESPTIPAAFPEGSQDELDWMKSLGSTETPAASASSDDETPDWLKSEASAQPAASTEQTSDDLDWMKGSTSSESPTASASLGDDTPDWMKGLDQPQQATESAAQSSSGFDFLDELKSTEGSTAMNSDESASKPASTPASADLGSLGSSEKELDDSFAWLESLAAKQGASEGLLMKPEERLEQEPDWVKQAKSLSTGELKSSPAESAPMEQLSAVQEMPVQPQPMGAIDDLGKSEKDLDDSFAWLESLAAKQGASEGLLINPEDRLEQAPDWVNQAKEIGESQPASTSQPQEPASMDTGMWLRSLDDEKSDLPSRSDETGMWLQGLDEPESKPAEISEPASDDTAMWLKSLDDSAAKPEPAVESSSDETAMWLKNLEEPEAAPAVEATQSNDLPDWMQSAEEEKKDSEAESAIPAWEAEVSSAVIEQPVASESPKTDTGSLPSWLRGLDDEKQPAAKEDLPAWLRDGTGELVAEPTKIEPTRAADWQPMETQAAVPPVEEKPVEKPVVVKPVEKPKPAPQPKKPVETKKPEPRAATPVSAYQEPVTRKGTGMLTQTVDMVLGQARNELNRSNIPGALETYSKLIKKGRYLDEVIFDLREALYRYPVEVSIWQTLGDAYNRANRLQDALDAYTKAEELLR